MRDVTLSMLPEHLLLISSDGDMRMPVEWPPKPTHAWLPVAVMGRDDLQVQVLVRRVPAETDVVLKTPTERPPAPEHHDKTRRYRGRHRR